MVLILGKFKRITSIHGKMILQGLIDLTHIDHFPMDSGDPNNFEVETFQVETSSSINQDVPMASK